MDSYTITYRDPESFFKFKQTIKDVKTHWLDDMASQKERNTQGYVPRPPIYWGVETWDGAVRYIKCGSYFKLGKGRVKVAMRRMSKESGQTIVAA